MSLISIICEKKDGHYATYVNRTDKNVQYETVKVMLFSLHLRRIAYN